jgi:hypothetical protein
MEDCLSSFSDSHLSDFSIGNIELYGGTPVTNESFEILELQTRWIEEELGIIEQMKNRFLQNIIEVTNYHLTLLNLDQSLSRLFLNSIYFDEIAAAMPYLKLLWDQQQSSHHNSGIQQEFFNATFALLNALSQIKCDELNLRLLRETNREMNFSPCSVEEMHAYYKRLHKERRENHLKASAFSSKAGNKKGGAVPKFIEFQIGMPSSGPCHNLQMGWIQ